MTLSTFVLDSLLQLEMHTIVRFKNCCNSLQLCKEWTLKDSTEWLLLFSIVTAALFIRKGWPSSNLVLWSVPTSPELVTQLFLRCRLLHPSQRQNFMHIIHPHAFCPSPSQIQVLSLMRDCQEMVQVSCFLLGTLVEHLQPRYLWVLVKAGNLVFTNTFIKFCQVSTSSVPTPSFPIFC